MQRIPKFQFRLVRYALCAAFCSTLIVSSAHPVVAKSKVKRTRPITKPKFDPNAEKVNLWEAMKEKQVATKVIAKNEQTGKILFENKTDKPLTVLLPESFVAVPVNAQFGGGGGGFGGQGGGFGGQGGGFGGQGGGQQQPVGGGFGGQGGGGGGGFGGQGGQGGQGGGGFFSIPPGKIVSVPFKAVCLAHGKPTPTPKTKMMLIPTEMYTKNGKLREIIAIVGNSRINQKALQAATWHITDKMSWQQLAKKSTPQLGGLGPKAYFTRAELIGATNIVAVAAGRAKEREKEEKKEPEKETPRVRTSRVSVK